MPNIKTLAIMDKNLQAFGLRELKIYTTFDEPKQLHDKCIKDPETR